MSLSVVILAAGKGTRMKSDKPKVLHELAGKPLLGHVYDTAKKLGAEEVVIIYGHGGEQVKTACASFDAVWVEQKQQLGTGHAVQHAMEAVNPRNDVLVLYGDVPLATDISLKLLIEDFDNKISLMTVILDNPTGYGRIIRNQHDKVVAIVEQKDATDDEKNICEVNTGILAANASVLNDLLSKIDNNNSQQEYYLTDIFALASQQGIEIVTSHPANTYEVEGINTRQQLAVLERIHQNNIASKLMENGVTICDPARIDVRGELEIDNDVMIDINVILQGKVKIGKGSSIGANCIIVDSIIGENVIIKANCVIESSMLDDHVEVGPFARLRPDTVLSENSRVGNFVEIKKSTIGKGSKVNHLSYIGDTDMGEDVNIGAGTITCNYDGANKHKTTIKDKVFVGSNSQLVAPVILGENATIAAGATITKDVEDGALAISRSAQKSIKNWLRPSKK
ncbi:MAG: bifunctional UDP-N-acetylglucosamine diphosphorylase/glucosamine-1-phosphate N-acetyltransferase GlmU [Gammaproteobacteria bacterium]